MTTHKKSKASKAQRLQGSVSLYSNSPYQPTGYGQQAGYLVERMMRAGLDVASISNYGLEGNNSKLQTPYGEIPHYSRGLEMYSNDVAPLHHKHFASQHPDQNALLMTLYDVWVFQGAAWDKMDRIASWVPLDHITMPPKVEAWLRKPNVTPIAMAPFGVEQMASKGIECEYVPHGIDTKIFRPTKTVSSGQSVREFMGVSDDQFLIGSVAANKSSGLVHRKAFSENLLAFSIFRQTHPDAVLYLHTEPLGQAGGWNLVKMLEAFGVPKDAVLFPNPLDFRYGFEQQDLAAFYSAMDVLLAPSYGGGFEIPLMEAQACGTRVIASNWTAPKDLVSSDGWKVEGMPQWDAGQEATWVVPSVPSIVNALEQAYQAERGPSQASIDFASNFDVDLVWDKHWVPVLNKLLK